MDTAEKRSIAQFDERFELGTSEESHRTGVRYWVIAVKNKLDELKDEQGKTACLSLEAKMALVCDGQAVATIEALYPLGCDRAAHRLGLRDMVAALRVALAEQLQDTLGKALTLQVTATLRADPSSGQ
jgi:hypothetical protein